MQLNSTDFTFLATCLEGILYGLYSGIFALYIQSRNETHNAKKILFYALCFLYLLSSATIILDLPSFCFYMNGDIKIVYPLYITGSTLFGCCDFIAQSILIYRCWIVWNQDIRVVIIPSLLAVAFLGTWTASTGAQSIEQGQIINTASWGNRLNITSLVISMTVNALVTGLIVFKIFKVFQQIKATSDKRALSVTSGGTKLRSVMFIIIESGIALFCIQLARLFGTIVLTTAAYDVFQLTASIHQMLNGITPTIILVRVSMGLSFYDRKSMVETAGTLLRFTPGDPNLNSETDGNMLFAPNHMNSTLEMESISQEATRRDDIGI